MVDMSHLLKPVHRSLLPRELAAGVPQTGLLIVGMLALIFCYGLGVWIALVPLAVLFFVMRLLTKKDEWMIDIVLDNIMQKDRLIP